MTPKAVFSRHWSENILLAEGQRAAPSLFALHHFQEQDDHQDDQREKTNGVNEIHSYFLLIPELLLSTRSFVSPSGYFHWLYQGNTTYSLCEKTRTLK
jgi:hypothetical protein